ncbi:hypothetical protein NDU88_001919 [Pleurodeles waltl]|uniref:Uncharacterized protein n=1 Tax=Pleurodeles waltl TaxID=8319 RepID=A0AAV7T0U9_PLEWA|nr:hypothetical protein NDU88_001919 [Pleurodeles waltl]
MWRDKLGLPPMEMLQTMIAAAVKAAMRTRKADTMPRKLPHLDPDPLPDGGEEDVKVNFVQGTDVMDILVFIREIWGFSAPVMASTEKDCLAQYQCPEPGSLPLHISVKRVLTNEWMDLECQFFPSFLLKWCPLEGFSEEYASKVKVDNLMAGLSTQESVISEDALPSDPVDRKIKAAVK